MKLSNNKVVIVGAGNVGVSTAFALINQGICDEICMIDLNEEKTYGEVLDMSHCMEYMNRNVKVRVGTYEDCENASIVIITASAPMPKDKNDRLSMLESSMKIMRSIVGNIMKHHFDGHMIIVSNPVDVMTYYAYKLSGLPSNQVMGSGTTLDTARLRFNIAKHLDVDPRSVNAFVIGEHGDSEMVPWSTVTVGGKDIYSLVRDNEDKFPSKYPFEQILNETIRDGWEIFNRKGNTCYGIASSTTGLVKSILFNENKILPISTLLNGEYGEENVFVSVPTVVNHTGAREIVELNLTPKELEEFQASCKHMKSFYKDLDC